jgi:RNA-binding protein YhbY
MARIKNKKITELHFDQANINKGSEYGMALLNKSISELGFVRSVAVDKNGILIAGNKTVEVAGGLGLEKVVEIETDGTELIVVKRTDLDINSEKGIKAKILDNTVSRHNYVQDATIAQAVCEKADIMNIHMYGLGDEPTDVQQNDEGSQAVAFSASTKPVIKVEMASKELLATAEKDIRYLMNQKYPGAIVTVKGGK